MLKSLSKRLHGESTLYFLWLYSNAISRTSQFLANVSVSNLDSRSVTNQHNFWKSPYISRTNKPSLLSHENKVTDTASLCKHRFRMCITTSNGQFDKTWTTSYYLRRCITQLVSPTANKFRMPHSFVPFASLDYSKNVTTTTRLGIWTLSGVRHDVFTGHRWMPLIPLLSKPPWSNFSEIKHPSSRCTYGTVNLQKLFSTLFKTM